MGNQFYLLLFLMAVGFGLIIAFLNKKLSNSEEKDDTASFLMLNQNIQGMQERLDKTTVAITDRLDKAAQVISGVQKELGGVQEIGKDMREFQDFLRATKKRGNIGEQVLKDLLEQMIPKANLRLQYEFKTGAKVDAIIKTKNGLIPIDSKFKMESYQNFLRAENDAQKTTALREFFRAVKLDIDDIAKKYILPSEGTVDFAIMYLPSQAIFQEVSENSELCDYASQKRIFIVSPDSFYYFLKVIMLALGNERIEETAKEVLASLRGIQVDARKFGDDLSVLNKHVSNAKENMEKVNASYARLGTKIENTGQLQESTVKQLEESTTDEL